PGLSLNATAEIPEQRAVFTDGDAHTSIDAGAEAGSFGYLDSLTSALPYHLANPQRVAVLGAGGGALVRQALYHNTASITAVELNPQMVDLVQNDYRDFSGGIYGLNSVDVRIEDARGFFSGKPPSFDLIEIELIDSFAASSAGLLALNASYLYTVEAFSEYFANLNDGGYLAISRWVKLPPRDTLKLFATAIEMLRSSSVSTPATHLLMIRGWQTSTVLVKNGHFTEQEIAAARRFCDTHSFDLVFYADMPETLANRYNVLSDPVHYRAAQALTGHSPRVYLDDYKFNINPATDDRPYFFYFFKWQSLPEILSLVGQGGVPLLESGYLILIATLIQAVFVSAALVLLPLWKRMRHANVHRRRMTWYFCALGFAFFFVEIAFIQKFLLFLHHPVMSVASILGGFLIFAGMGSYMAGRWHVQRNEHNIILAAAVSIVTIGLLYVILLPTVVFEPLASANLPTKLAVSVLLTGILAIPMGMPFPLGIARLGERAPNLVPTAWAINGCASVISAVLATVLAIHFGFTVVLLLAFALYLSAAIAFRF
ncbi:MAG: SAM-dependent methyltransferase, partial [Pseudomonadales bacterium]